MPLPPRQPRQRRKETRPQELLDAALALFVEKGFAATRSEEVARRAGVSKGTLYLYYPSKEELFKAVVRQNLTHLIDEGAGLLDRFDGPSADLLRRLVDLWWQRFAATPAAGIHKVMLAEVRNFPELAQFYVDEVIDPTRRLFAGLVQRGIDRGEFRALPTREAALALMAPVIFLSLHRHSFGACPMHGDELDPVAILRTQVDLALGGLLRHPAAAPEPSPAEPLPKPRAARRSAPTRPARPLAART
jgi:AcrR family transcriptional regulator